MSTGWIVAALAGAMLVDAGDWRGNVIAAVAAVVAVHSCFRARSDAERERP